MNAKLEYRKPMFHAKVDELCTKYFEGEILRFITGGSDDYRVYVNDNFVFSISPNHFISWEFYEATDLQGNKI
jgi:hypothetical protein